MLLHAAAMQKKKYWIEEQEANLFPNPMTMWMVTKWTRLEQGLRKSIYTKAEEMTSNEQLKKDLQWQHH